MIRFYIPLFLLLLSCKGISSTTDTRQPKTITNYSEEYAEGIVHNWDFLVFKEPLEVEIIRYFPAFTRCNRSIDNAIALVVTNNDTIRIIDECPGPKEYLEGEKALFTPSGTLPQNKEIGLIRFNDNPNPSIFEGENITKTSFGKLSKTRGIENFDWLVGTWEGVNNTEQEQSFEIWEKLGSQTYRGIGYTLEDGDTVFMEKLSIENVYGVYQYIVRVGDESEKPVHFEMLKVNSSGFMCANPKHDFPKQIDYKLDGERLTATISGDGKSRSFIFRKQ